MCVKNNQTPNVTAEWLALLLRVQEVPGLSLGLETGCPDVFVVFLGPSSKCRDSTLN
jgi:hypothetical protein